MPQNPNADNNLTKLRQITDFEDSLNKNPNDSQLLLQLAHLLNDSGFKRKAIEKYNDYLKVDPKNADVLVDRGVCYYDLHQYDEAINSMESAIKDSAGSSNRPNEFGNCKYGRRKYR